ncbi:cytochrome P450 [Lentzea sp. NPDC058436]|uniref:cytochrome P450 n=1 Tax=Lentzea sp. NPDC058436 TaxID=3346499 RepID=UPI00365551BF
MAAPEEPPRCPFDHVDGLGFEPQLRRLLHEEPVARVRLAHGEGPVWIVTRYDDVRSVTTDRRFSRAALVGRDFPRITPKPIAPPGSIFVLDPPEHGRLRAALGRAFAPRPLERMREQTQAVVGDLLGALESVGGPADLMSALAAPLPTRVISQVLGIAPHERDWLKDQAAALKVTDPSHERAAIAAQQALHDYVVALVERRRREPADDLVSTLAAPADGAEQLTEAELVSLVVSLILTGHDNVTNEVGDICFTLLTDQELLARARADLPAVLDELVRYLPYRRGVGTPRVALEDVEIGGRTIREGEIVHVSYIAANQDPDRFPGPEVIDPDRPHVPNLAFGWGTHRCPAEALARMEISVAVGSLLTRFPALRLAVRPQDVEWESRNVNRLPLSLPVVW